MVRKLDASIAQLGERQTEDLKVPGSIPGRGILCLFGPFSFVICGVVGCLTFGVRSVAMGLRI